MIEMQVRSSSHDFGLLERGVSPWTYMPRQEEIKVTHQLPDIAISPAQEVHLPAPNSRAGPRKDFPRPAGCYSKSGLIGGSNK